MGSPAQRPAIHYWQHVPAGVVRETHQIELPAARVCRLWRTIRAGGRRQRTGRGSEDTAGRATGRRWAGRLRVVTPPNKRPDVARTRVQGLDPDLRLCHRRHPARHRARPVLRDRHGLSGRQAPRPSVRRHRPGPRERGAGPATGRRHRRRARAADRRRRDRVPAVHRRGEQRWVSHSATGAPARRSCATTTTSSPRRPPRSCQTRASSRVYTRC